MKQMQIALVIFITILFLGMPITQAISWNDVKKRNENINAASSFKVKLTDEQMQSVHEFINSITSKKEQITAQCVTNQILSDDKEIDIQRIGELLQVYRFENISRYEETTTIVDDVLNFLIQLVIERLGWVYDLLQKTTDVLSDIQRLWNDKTIPKEILTELQLLTEKLSELQNLTTLLIEGEYLQFLKIWNPGIIIQDITQSISYIQTLANDIGILVGDIARFISDITDFITWLSNTPWEQPIHIYGKVIMGTIGIPNVVIRCRETTSKTDEEGNFSFFVNATPDEYSLPPNVYYGVHQCVIIAEYNGTLKETPRELSYTFSNGGIYWVFSMNDDSNTKETAQIIHVYQMGIWSWIYSKMQNTKICQWIFETHWL